MEAYLTENCPPTFHFRGRSSVEAVLKGWLKGWLKGGLQGGFQEGLKAVLRSKGDFRGLR